MSNATRWYCGREAVKAAVGIAGSKYDALIDSYIETASEGIERLLASRRTQFIPQTAIRYFPWPQKAGRGTVLELDQDLLAVTLLQAAAQDAVPITITATDYFLEPINQPPYRRIEIDLSSTAVLEAGDTTQRSIAVTGRWGYSEDTKAAGALAAAMNDTTGTVADVTDASLIDAGDTLLIQTEALFVSERAALDTTANLNDSLTADINDVTVTVTDGTLVKRGEVVQVDSEKMLVESITGNDLTVQRQYDGSILAAHTGAVDLYAFRRLTVVRGVNGTTAATHVISTAISRYAPPADIADLCRAEAIARLKQGESGWTGQIGGGEGSVRVRMLDIQELRDRVLQNYGWVTL